MATWNKYFWYGIVFILSLITLFAIPMLGSEAGLEWKIPNTTVGWIVWGVSNIAASILNVLMFHSFTKQAKVNVAEDPRYIEAEDLMRDNEIEPELKPESPEVLVGRTYKRKGITIFIFTLLGTIGLGQAILAFDGVKFLSQVIVLGVGLVCGVMQMKHVEDIWTIDYLAYAKYKVKEKQEAEAAALSLAYNEVHEKTIIEAVYKQPVEPKKAPISPVLTEPDTNRLQEQKGA